MLLAHEQSGYTIFCDVPNCAEYASLDNEVLQKMHNHASGWRTNVALRIAEAKGWFKEVLSTKGKLLLRDICPKHADSYRTLANLRSQNHQ
jgi:hypothetical protein